MFKSLIVLPLVAASVFASALPRETGAANAAKRADPIGDVSSALSDASSAVSDGLTDATSAVEGAFHWGTSVGADGVNFLTDGAGDAWTIVTNGATDVATAVTTVGGSVYTVVRDKATDVAGGDNTPSAASPSFRFSALAPAVGALVGVVFGAGMLL